MTTTSRDFLLVAGLLGGVVVGGCGPVANVGSGSETMASTGSGGGMTGSSGPGVTGSGGVTSEGSTGTSTGSSTGMMPTTAEPTCGGFVCETDMLLVDDCDVFAQECPEGEKCVAVITDGGGAWNAARCVPVLGMGAPGEPCTAKSVAEGLDSCAKGAMCWGVDMDGHGTCVGLCTGGWEAPMCPEPHVSCTISGSGVLNLCLPGCEPLLQDCGPGEACYPIDDSFTCAPDASGDVGEANDPCEFINVCAAGLLCGDPMFVGAGCPPGSMGCCTPFCGFPDGVCPNPDQQCVQWFDPAMLPEGDSWLAIGACGVPQ